MAEMIWSRLLNAQRMRDLKKQGSTRRMEGESRTEYERDRDRSMYSTPFRRLSGKTQVFPLDQNDLVRTRLTHSLEVSAVAEGLAAQAVRSIIREKATLTLDEQNAIPKIAETCALLHDIGNPPFGHAGELAIGSWFHSKSGLKALTPLNAQQKEEFRRFEGNAQTLRIVTNSRLVGDENGLNLTCATVSGLRKYLARADTVLRPADWHEMSKPGYFSSEQELLTLVEQATGTQGMRNPITFLVEAADDIVYSAVDLEDALRKQLLTQADVDLFLNETCPGDSFLLKIRAKAEEQMGATPRHSAEWMSEYPQTFRVAAISAAVRAVVDTFSERYDQIMRGWYHKELIDDDACEAKNLIAACKKLLKTQVFRNHEVLGLEVRGRRVIHDLMDSFWEGIEEKIANPSKESTKTYGGKLYLLISANYRSFFEKRLLTSSQVGEQLYAGLQLLTDQVCNMTDGYACRLHRELNNG